MKFIARCIDAIERRPFVFWSLFIFFFVLSYLEQLFYSIYQSFLAGDVNNLFSFFFNTNDKSTENLGNVVAGATTPENTVTIGSVLLAILIIALLLFAFSAILSIYFSGYFHTLNLSLQANKEKVPGEFKKGLVKHYFKFAVYIFLHVAILLVTAVGAIFAMFPAKLSFDMVYSGGNNGLMMVSIFLILLSIIVIAFVVAIILMYTSYVYPALVCFKKGAGYMAKKVVNAKFWYILPRLMCFVILFAAWQYFLGKIEYGLVSYAASMAVFVLNAIVKTYLVFMFLFFVFFTFRQIKNVLQAEEEDISEEIPAPKQQNAEKAKKPVQQQTQRPAQRAAQAPEQRPAQQTAHKPVQRAVQRPAQEHGAGQKVRSNRQED